MLHYRSKGYCYYFPTLGFRTRKPNHGLGSPLRPNTVKSIPKPPFPSNHIEFKKETYHQIKWPYELQDKDSTHFPEILPPPPPPPHFLTATRPERPSSSTHRPNPITTNAPQTKKKQTLNLRSLAQMPFFAKLKLKLKAAWTKVSLPFVKKSAERLRTPAHRQPNQFPKICSICKIALVPYRFDLCYNCKYFH